MELSDKSNNSNLWKGGFGKSFNLIFTLPMAAKLLFTMTMGFGISKLMMEIGREV